MIQQMDLAFFSSQHPDALPIDRIGFCGCVDALIFQPADKRKLDAGILKQSPGNASMEASQLQAKVVIATWCGPQKKIIFPAEISGSNI